MGKHREATHALLLVSEVLIRCLLKAANALAAMPQNPQLQL